MVHPDIKCIKPKTFAVIDHIEEINSPSLNKSFDDYDKQFFYSEAWSARNLDPHNITFNYPLVTTTYINSQIISKGNKDRLSRTTVHLNCFDTIKDECKITECNTRTHHEIETDCLKVLINILHYLDDVYIAEYKGELGFYNRGWLDYRKETFDEPIKLLRRAQIFTDLDNIFAQQYETGIEFTYGAQMKLDIRVAYCADTNYNFNIAEPLKKIGGCCG